MPRREEDPSSVARMFHAAASGHGEWKTALTALATLTGSAAGELIGFGQAKALTFYCSNGLPAEYLTKFAAAQGYDPSVSSRIRIGLQAPVLEVLDDRHFSTAEDMARNPEFAEATRELDVPYICLSNVLRQKGMSVGLSVVRREAQGWISDAERRAFAEVAPHVRSAARTFLEVDRRNLSLITHTLEAVSACAFVCDVNAVVRAMSPAAEALLRDGGWLKLRDGVIVAHTANDTRRLHKTLHAAAASGGGTTPPPPPMAIINAQGELLPLDAMPFQPADTFRYHAVALLLARPPLDLGERAGRLAQLLFNLTPKETTIAAELVRGRTLAAIAAETGTAIGTVRVQLRSLFAKAGVRSQGELIARLSAHL